MNHNLCRVNREIGAIGCGSHEKPMPFAAFRVPVTRRFAAAADNYKANTADVTVVIVFFCGLSCGFRARPV